MKRHVTFAPYEPSYKRQRPLDAIVIAGPIESAVMATLMTPTAPTVPTAMMGPTVPMAPTAPTVPTAPTAPTAPKAPTAIVQRKTNNNTRLFHIVPTAPVLSTPPTHAQLTELTIYTKWLCSLSPAILRSTPLRMRAIEMLHKGRIILMTTSYVSDHRIGKYCLAAAHTLCLLSQ